MKNMGNMSGMMKQVKKMQQDMARAQEELAELEVSASSGGGMVTVTANGKQELLSIEIKPDAVDPDDVEMLEDLVLAATNEALRKASDAASEHMAKVTGPLQGMLPPGMGF
ncbi:YbaB/EbfC family nucleoid-associated protein [bacterium]|nr:YbaB/EbfC family nucleoid-associated protein [bacterium]